MVAFKKEGMKLLIHSASIASVIITVLSFLFNDVVFISTGYGVQFSYKNSLIIKIAVIFITILTIALIILYLRWLRESVMKRDRMQALLFLILCCIITPFGFATDFIIPVFTGNTAVPLMTICFLPVSLLFFLSMKKYRTLSITVPSASGYIFDLVTIPIFVLDHKNNINLENKAAINFFGRSFIGSNIADTVLLNEEIKVQSFLDNGFADKTVSVKTPNGVRICDILLTVERDKYNDAILKILLFNDLTEIRKREKEIDQRDNLLSTVNNAITILLQADSTEFESALWNSMGMMAKAVNADRAYIWKNYIKNGMIHCTQLYEWSEGAEPQQGNVYTTDIPYEEKTPEWVYTLSRGKCINSLVRDMSPAEQTLLAPQGIISILVVPVFLREKFWGFVGFDDCHRERLFTENEESILRSGSLLIANALLRNEMTRELAAALEKAQAASIAKSSFLANMSHEIRTPMNSIMGFAELVLDKAISPQVKEYLGKITDSTKWLLNIINDILDISKIESGKMELEKVSFDLHTILTRCQSVIQPNVAEKGLDFQVCAEPLEGKRLLGDPVKLYQALMNLLSNAVKFTKAGTIKLSSVIRASNDSTVTIYFEIKDSGIGMTAEQIKKVFEPFIQADSSTTRNYGGTGLGLTIAQNIVEMMGGELAVVSVPGAGSTFSFELVFETIHATDDGLENIEINTIEKPHFNGLVLICEDNPMNQQVISENLERVGLRSVIAENGKKGVETVQTRLEEGEPPFDMIFMDIFMPVMDGLEAAKKIRELGIQTPIVAMTANMITSELDNYKKSGMEDCVGKPFTTQELWRCLLKYLTF